MAKRKYTREARHLQPFIAQVGKGIVDNNPPEEGPGIDLVDRKIGLGGDSILIYHPNGNPASEFAATSLGLSEALAAALDGDVVMLPAGEISGDQTVPAGVSLVGMGRDASILSGKITLNDRAVIKNVGILRTAEDDLLLSCVIGPISGVAEIFDSKLSCTQNGTGDTAVLAINDGNIITHHCYVNGISVGGTGNEVLYLGDGHLISMQDDYIDADLSELSGSITWNFNSGLEDWVATLNGDPMAIAEWNNAIGHSSVGSLHVKRTVTATWAGNYTHQWAITPASRTMHTGDTLTLWMKHSNPYQSPEFITRILYTDGSYDQDAWHPNYPFDWTQRTVTVTADNNGKKVQSILLIEIMGGWDENYSYDTWWDDITIGGQGGFDAIGTRFSALPESINPLYGDRAASNAADYPLVHTNDIDTLDGIHHTLGTDATQAAPGNHTHDDRYYTESETATLLDGKSDVDHTHTHFTDTTNPHSVTKDQVGLGNVANLKCNLAATSAPVASDDSADGYAVGSSWFDVTNDKSYLCLDATVDAAIWQEVGAGGASTLHDLTDVDDTGKANGDRLTYNSTTAKWEPEALASNLDGLTDVVITTPATGQVLKYDGTNWKNDSDLVGTGGSDATAIHDDTAGEISLITEKTALVDNDLFLIEDSAASYAKKRVKKSNIGADVTGPSSAVSGNLAIFDGTTGKKIKDGGVVPSGGIIASGVIDWTVNSSTYSGNIDLSSFDITDDMADMAITIRIVEGGDGNPNFGGDWWTLTEVAFERTDDASTGAPDYLKFRIRRLVGGASGYHLYIRWHIIK